MQKNARKTGKRKILISSIGIRRHIFASKLSNHFFDVVFVADVVGNVDLIWLPLSAKNLASKAL